MLLFTALLLQLDLSSLDVAAAAKAILEAVTAKNWFVVTGLLVWLLVYVTRKYGAALPWVGTWLGQKFLTRSWSGPALAVLFATAGALINTFGAGVPFSLPALFVIIGNAAVAVFTQEVQQKAREAGAQASGAIATAADADKFLKGK